MLTGNRPTLRDTLQRAIEAHFSGNLAEAARLYNRVLRASPKQFDALHLLGAIEGQLGQHGKAHRLLSMALRVNPNSADALNNLGNVLWAMKRYDEAAAAFEKALAIQPRLVPALNNRGNALRHAGRFEEALDAYQSALAIKPDYAEALSNCGDALQDLGRPEEALAWYDRALAAGAAHPQAFTNRGNALRSLLRLEEALQMYARALAIDPNFAQAHVSEAMCRLLMGDWSRGWIELERRWDTDPLAAAKRDFKRPLWLGNQEIAERSILLHAEQGLGDTIQFCRYAPMVAGKGARVVLEVPAPLKSLLRSLVGVDVLIQQGEPIPPTDLHCPLMSLPLAFGTTLESVPSAPGYLTPDPEHVGMWRERLKPVPGAKVGIVWAGGQRRDPQAGVGDRRRSMALSQFAALATVAGATFISLQVGEPAEEASSPPAGMNLVDWTAELNDFADTAALVAALDLVISVDTSVAHLAGALGRPVWLLNCYESEWRWLLEREDSPWYPTMRIFRQSTSGDWTPVVERVAGELASGIAGGGFAGVRHGNEQHG
jgi:tetratricopeptide (TPR) repeat protein